MKKLWIEDRLHRSLIRYTASLPKLIGKVENPQQERELIISFIRLVSFNAKFKKLYEEVITKTDKLIKAQETKSFYCEDLGYTVQLDDDNNLTIIEDED